MKFQALATFTLLTSSALFSAQQQRGCEPEPAAPCNQDDCCRTYCLGPENYASLPPVRPNTCNGDFEISVAGVYWAARQEGLSYAINIEANPTFPATERQFGLEDIIGAEFESPNFKWDFGFKLGFAYVSKCDGWDIGVTWTRFRGKAFSHVETDQGTNRALLPIWSNHAAQISLGPLFATDIETRWSVDINLIDVELGREFWVSRKVTLRPHMGVRAAYLNQDYDLQHKGGTFFVFEPFNNEVELRNNFHGVGVRGGLDSNWHFGCGWSLYGDLALSLLYGRFNLDHSEVNRLAESPFRKTQILEVDDSFRASRFAADLSIGIQWSALFCDCDYAFTAQFGWEQHIFLDQNQLWRVDKIENNTSPSFYENVYAQSRGDLDTAGWTLSLKLAF